MSVIVTSCRAPAVVAGPSRQQQPRTAAVRQPLRPCRSALCFRQAAVRQAQPLAAARRQVLAVRAQSGGEPKRNTEFGYSRKDVLIIGGALTGAGFALYYGLQATGMDAGMAGNWAQLIIFVGLCFGWVGSYLFRVATKQMTYVKQLEDYEEAVMRKRLEEMPEAEVERMLGEVEADKEARRSRATGSSGGSSGGPTN